MKSGGTEFMKFDEFTKLLKSAKPEHLYEELVQKEDKLLQTMNRVVDYSNKKDMQSKEFLNTPVKDVARGFMSSMLGLFEDLVKMKTIDQLIPAMMQADRIIYSGILIIVFSVILFFLDIA